MTESARLTVLGVSVRIARAIVTVVVVLDLAALAGFAFHSTTTVRRTVTPIAESVPITPQAPAAPAVPTGGSGGGPIAIPVSNDAPPPRPAATHKPSTPKPTKTHKPAPPPKHTLPPVPKAAIGKCPVKLAEPAHAGGLQSLVPLAPAFGPFSAEAFAAASAYQPELQLLGPILAQYPKFAPKVEPAMAPLLKLFGMGSKQLFGLISPFYAPHRTQVLQAETKLAAVFAPYSKKLVGQPLAGCVVDLEAAMVGDTHS